MFPRILDRVVEWSKAHKQSGLVFEEHGSHTWVFLRTWRNDDFYRVDAGGIDCYYGDASSQLVILGQVLSAIGGGVSPASNSEVSNTLADCYKGYLGSGYMRGRLECPSFDVKLLKRCLQKTASTVFGTLVPFLMSKFILTRLKGAERRDWMQSRQSLRKAIETGDFSLARLVDIVSNIFEVWLLIVSYPKETGEKDRGDSRVVCCFLVILILT